MGLFSSIFHAPQETSEQKRQRVLSQAIVSDKEIRFAKNFTRILNSFNKDLYPDVQRNDEDAMLQLVGLNEIQNEAIGKDLNPSQSRFCTRLENYFLTRMPELNFTIGLATVKKDIIAQISDALREDFDDPDSAEILNAKPNGSYVEICRRGIIKTINLYEQAGLHETACGMREMFL